MLSPSHDPLLISLDNLKKNPLPDWTGRASARAGANVLIVAATLSEPGESLLLSRAALRAGAGGVTVAVPAELVLPLSMALPEAAFLSLPDAALASGAEAAASAIREAAGLHTATVFAPSLDQSAEGQQLVRLATRGIKSAVVAGSSTLSPGDNFSDEPAFSSDLTARVYRISATETHWLGAESVPEADANTPRLKAALSWTEGHQNEVFLVTDAKTLGVFAEGKATHLPLDCAGLFAPGAEAVRSGIIAALLAQGLDAGLAAQWGTLLYAEGTLAITKDLGEDGFLARDIIDRLPAVLRYLKRQVVTLDKSGFGLRAVK